GHYTQIRFDVEEASMVVNGVKEQLAVPSDKLRTDENFDLDIGGGAVDLTVDFDLSRSIVSQGNGAYKLKPVLHLVETKAAASVSGTIAYETFGTASEATVDVYVDVDTDGIVTDNDLYTTVVVPVPAQPAPPAAAVDATFQVFWLVPNTAYVVRVSTGGVEIYGESVAAASVPTGANFALNGGNPDRLAAIGNAAIQVLQVRNNVIFPQNGAGATVTALDGVVVAPAPASLRNRLDIPIRIGLGLALGVVLAFLVWYFDPRIRDRADAEAIGLNIIAEIPKK
ncbi:MAG: DUF4382 domain-containing protein, partial [Chloroflexi bacterium]|nr:DUF4382 domain-containing protein [Chloroflexota bacterium]